MEFDIATVVTALLSIGGATAAVYLVKAKGKLSKLRALIDELDDDLVDNSLTQEEYARIVAKAKALFA